MTHLDVTDPSDPDPDRLGPALRGALVADQARLTAPPVQGVLDRSRRRRSMHATAGAALAVAVLASAVGVATLTNRGGEDAVQFADPSPAAQSQTLAVLDSGVGADGPWRIEATTADGVCITYSDSRREGGSCQLAGPVRLDESSLISVIDDGIAQTVVAGPVPPAATRVAITTTDGPTTLATIVRVGTRAFFHTRIHPDVGVRLISAETDDGRVLATAVDLPPPPDAAVTGPTPPLSPAASPLAVPESDAGAGATASDLELAADLRAFAVRPGPDTAQRLPFANPVRLGLGSDLVRTAPGQELVQRATWSLPGPYAAYVGPFSALEQLQDERPYEVGVGPHPHCASPPRPAPPGLADARRVWLTPKAPQSCLDWYTVDVFLRDDAIVAITLDVWEP